MVAMIVEKPELLSKKRARAHEQSGVSITKLQKTDELNVLVEGGLFPMIHPWMTTSENAIVIERELES
jgi:hypothetical protein